MINPIKKKQGNKRDIKQMVKRRKNTIKPKGIVNGIDDARSDFDNIYESENLPKSMLFSCVVQ